MSKARILADLISDSQITASEITGLELNSIQEGDTVVQVSDTGSGGKVVVRVDGADNAEFNANGMVIPRGTTAERDPAAVVGSLRYNTTTGFFETFTSSGWGAVATPPSITSITPSNFNGEAGSTFTLDGAFFDVDTTAVFKGADGTEYAAATITFVSSTQITLTNATNLPVANEPFKVKVTNGAGLSVESVQGIDAGSVPAFTTAAGSIATTTRWDDAVSVTVQATDAENTISGYAVTQGNLPAGLSLNATTGAITGTSTEQATTTYTFTIGATDSAGNTNTRQFNIQIVNAAPVWSSPAEGSTHDFDQNSAGSITLSATDPEGEAVSYTSVALPTGLSISGNAISGTPITAGNTGVAVTASDGFISAVRNIYINVIAPPVFSQAFFEHGSTYTVGGSSGSSGPTLSQVILGLSGTDINGWKNNTTYLNVSNGVIQWTPAYAGNYQFDVRGAMGGLAYSPRSGYGANAFGVFTLSAGDTMKIIVGQMGSANHGGAGGGGSFVIRASDNTVLLAAGGGGGSGSGGGSSGDTSDANQMGTGQTTTSGAASSSYGGDATGYGGTNGGSGGRSPQLSSYAGGAGAGYLSGQADSAYSGPRGAYGALHPTYPGLGGAGYNDQSPGGFGGGGGGGEYGAGGGGGYSGGGSSNRHALGGGGGSYVDSSASSVSISSNFQDNDGKIFITKI